MPRVFADMAFVAQVLLYLSAAAAVPLVFWVILIGFGTLISHAANLTLRLLGAS